MFVTWAYILTFICIGSMHVDAVSKDTTFQVVSSTNISNADSTFLARSLIDCASGCMSFNNCYTAAYVKYSKQCFMSASETEVIVDVQDNDVITISMKKDKSLLSQYGTEFVTGFMRNALNGGDPHLIIVPSVPTATNVWVTIPYLGIHQEHHLLNGHLYLQYPNSLVPEASSIVTGKGVIVTSDQPIALFSLNYLSGSTGGTIELPKHLLGQLYIVDTINSTSVGMGQIVVSAVSNNTKVILMFPSGSNIIILLNEYETYQHQATNAEPLAGTIISADTSIAVHTGHMCANVPDDTTSACDMIVTAVPPVGTFGGLFIVPYQSPRTVFSVGIAAPFDATEITIQNSTGSTLEIVQLNKSDTVYRNYFSSEIISVMSNQNILVTQYGHGSNGLLGDPSLTVIPSTNQFASRYNFAVPTEFDDLNVVSIVINSVYDSAGLMLNGAPLIISESATVIVPGEENFNVMYVNVNSNVTYFLYHTNPTARFGAWLYVRGLDQEYTTVLGYSL